MASAGALLVAADPGLTAASCGGQTRDLRGVWAFLAADLRSIIVETIQAPSLIITLHSRARREHLQRFWTHFLKTFQANARMWPCLSYLGRIRPTAGLQGSHPQPAPLHRCSETCCPISRRRPLHQNRRCSRPDEVPGRR